MGVLNVPLIFYKIFINVTKISGGIMHNRYLDIKRDFSEVNEFQNYILPKIDGADWIKQEDKQIVKDYIRKIFFNQWKQKGE